MNKNIFLLALLFTASIFLLGCGSDNDDPAPPPPRPPHEVPSNDLFRNKFNSLLASAAAIEQTFADMKNMIHGYKDAPTIPGGKSWSDHMKIFQADSTKASVDARAAFFDFRKYYGEQFIDSLMQEFSQWSFRPLNSLLDSIRTCQSLIRNRPNLFPPQDLKVVQILSRMQIFLDANLEIDWLNSPPESFLTSIDIIKPNLISILEELEIQLSQVTFKLLAYNVSNL